MRYLLAILMGAMLSLAISTTAHAADAPASDADQLQKSLGQWEKARAECGGDYSYTVRWSSAFGFGHITTITVKGNKVVERKFEVFDPRAPVAPGEKPETPKTKWVESEKELGSHKPEGAAPRTLDELYAEAKKIVDQKLPENLHRYLKFDGAGLLNYCFTVDTRIADDAPRTGVPPFQLQLNPKKP